MNRLLVLLLVVCAAPSSAKDESLVDPIETEAVELLQAAVGRLANSNAFRMRSKIEFDSLQEDGQMLEFGASRTITVQRPNKARIETRRRGGAHTVLILDGERIWFYTPVHNVYGSAAQPGDVGVSLEFVARELEVDQPLSDLLAADPYAELTEGLTSAMIVGESEIDGVACLHAAYRNDVGDLQVWISDADKPELQRLVMTYRNEPGQPQLRADLVELDPIPKFDSNSFTFSPPEDAERLRFVVGTPSDLSTEGE